MDQTVTQKQFGNNRHGFMFRVLSTNTFWSSSALISLPLNLFTAVSAHCFPYPLHSLQNLLSLLAVRVTAPKPNRCIK